VTDFVAGVAMGTVIGGLIVAIGLGLALESLYRRVSELEKGQNGPERPETAGKGV
jgi:hypothetical protein